MSDRRISRRTFVGVTMSGASLAAWPVAAAEELEQSRPLVVVGAVPGAAPTRGVEAARATLAAAGAAGVAVAIVPAVGDERPGAGMGSLIRWGRIIQDMPDTAFVATDVGQWMSTARRGRVAVVGHAHGLQWIGRNLDLLADGRAAGLRLVKLTSGWRNLAADGGCEASNLGLTSFGRRAVTALNRAGLVIDLSSTGEKSSLEVMARTAAPVVFSHANARAVHDHPLNLTDEQIRACAATGGLIGISAFPALVGSGNPTVQDLFRHIEHIAELVGIDHVGLGLDFDAPRRKRYPDDPWPDPPYRYPAGLTGFADLPRFIELLGSRGYPPAARTALLGGNWERVWR